MSDPPSTNTPSIPITGDPSGGSFRVLYDGECPFCRRQVDRLLRWTGGRVSKATLQAEWPTRPIPEEMKLVSPDGRVFGGAEAVARALSLQPILRLIAWVYFIPGFRQIIDGVYRWIARNRYRLTTDCCPIGTCSRHHHEFILTEAGHAPALMVQRPTYRRSVKLFHVLFGLIYASAFASLYVQAPTLIGSRGLLPVAETLDTLRRNAQQSGAPMSQVYGDFPTLFWFDSTDSAIKAGCLAGVAAAIGLTVGLLRPLMLVILGALHISYVTAGQTFFNFQWDNLLIETTVHALLLPAYSWRLPRRRADDASHLRLPHSIAIFLMQWLLFRLYFESGIAKLLPATGGWRDLTAMSHYYETAPLATWIGWYAHNLPMWWHRIETALTLLVEVVLPVFIFAGRRWRRAIFFVFQSFQIAIALTANYGVFNYVTFALGFFLIEDMDYEPVLRVWRAIRRKARSATMPVYTPSLLAGLLRTIVLSVVALGIAGASLVEFSLLCIHDPDYRRQAVGWHTDGYWGRFRLVNSYHLFAGMTTERLVPQIEGVNDKGEWIAYRYRWAPADVMERPRFAAPHHPRLDFQIWFATLSPTGHRQAYFVRLLERLCGDPGFAADVFRGNPFDGGVPLKLRVTAYRYEMTTPQEREKTGAWWRKEQVRVLTAETACTSPAK